LEAWPLDRFNVTSQNPVVPFVFTRSLCSNLQPEKLPFFSKLRVALFGKDTAPAPSVSDADLEEFWLHVRKNPVSGVNELEPFENLTNVPDMYNLLVAYYARNWRGQQTKQAIVRTAAQMSDLGIPLDDNSFSSVAKALEDPEAIQDLVDQAVAAGTRPLIIHELRKLLILKHLRLTTDPDSAPAESAFAVLQDAVADSSASHNQQLYGCFVNWHANRGDEAGARSIMVKMAADGVLPDVQTYLHVLKLHCSGFKLDIQAARGILGEMSAAGIQPNGAVFHMLMNVYSKQSDADGVRQIMDESAAAAIPPHRTSYQLLLLACTTDKCLGKFWAAADDMKAAGFLPGRDEYYPLLRHHAKKGRLLECRRILAELEAAGLEIDKIGYTCLLDCYARQRSGGYFAAAVAILHSMESDGLVPGNFEVAAVLRCCGTSHKYAESAEYWFIRAITKYNVRVSGRLAFHFQHVVGKAQAAAICEEHGLNLKSLLCELNHDTRPKPMKNIPKAQQSHAAADPRVDLFLASLNLAHHSAQFTTHEVDYETLIELTDLELEKVGIKALGARKKILRKLTALEKGGRRAGDDAQAAAALPAGEEPGHAVRNDVRKRADQKREFAAVSLVGAQGEGGGR
jgi:hypothetical protein